MNFKFDPREEKLRQEIRAFAQAELLPRGFGFFESGYEYNEEGWPLTREITKKLVARGWLAPGWPKKYGGGEYSPTEELVYWEEMVYNRVPGIDVGVGSVMWIGPALLRFGSEEQRREHLPPITRAERFWCTAYSEPEAGSDIASVKSQARRDGNDYIISGQKIWTTAAHVADWCWFLARTDPSKPKHRGLSLFLIDMTSPGITIRPIAHNTGLHCFNEVFFDQVRVPRQNLVGEENQGWLILNGALETERATAGLRVVASSRRTLEEVIEFVGNMPKRQKIMLGDKQVLRHNLAELAVELEVGRLLAYKVAWIQSKQQDATAAAAVAKLFGTELIQRCAEVAIKTLGLYGQLLKGSPRAKLDGRIPYMRLTAISLPIGAGTSEVLRTLIASWGLGLPRQ
jgi:alkylation response protein AidB-like acyl-CoA dehydrogenase